MFYLLAFVFGAVIGSFLNVVALRYNTGFSIGGRSRCFSCGHTLTWPDLVPLFSYLFLRGKCRKCGSHISLQYPAIEFLTGLIFLGIFNQLQEPFFQFIFSTSSFATFTTTFLLPFIFYAVVWGILVVILIYDIRHTIIPDGMVYSFIVLSILHLVFMYFRFGFGESGITWFDILSGPVLFLFFFSLWFFSGGRWMGFGDAKLALGIGLFLGATGISATVFAFWVGSVVALMLLGLQTLSAGKTRLLIAGKELTIHSEIPFAPFLVIGMALVFFFNLNLSHVLSF